VVQGKAHAAADRKRSKRLLSAMRNEPDGTTGPLRHPASRTAARPDLSLRGKQGS